MSNSTETTLRKAIVKVCQALSARGMVAASDGNVSAKLDEDRILITPSCFAKEDVGEADLLICDMEGNKLSGVEKVSSEHQVHLAAYRVRPEIQAVVHAHPIIATAFTFAGKEKLLTLPIFSEVVHQIGQVQIAPYHIPGTKKLSDAVAVCYQKGDVVLMAQHGAVTLGPDPWVAYLRMEKLEHFASIIKHARELAGCDEGLKTLTPEQVESLKGYKPPSVASHSK